MSRAEIPGTSLRVFATTEERDRFIDENFPKRSCTDMPGFFRLPSGGYLSVLFDAVRFPSNISIKEPK